MAEMNNYQERSKPIVEEFDIPIGGTFKREIITLPAGSSLYDLYEAIRSIPGSGHRLIEKVILIYEETH